MEAMEDRSGIVDLAPGCGRLLGAAVAESRIDDMLAAYSATPRADSAAAWSHNHAVL